MKAAAYSPQALQSIAGSVSQVAADLVREAAGSPEVLHTKTSATDVVTATDLKAEELIRDELMRRCPGSSIHGEELADHVGQSEIGWIVDPIDGTVNFLYGVPIVAVSVAATVNGRVVAGAVTDVFRGETFVAAEGHGAWLEGARLQVIDPPALSDSLIVTGFSYDATRRASQAAAIQRILPAARDIRCFGSAAIHLCWVAANRCNAYFELDTKIYDYAAGALIATEAGASVVLPSGTENDLILAAAPKIGGHLRTLIEPVDGDGQSQSNFSTESGNERADVS